jgi:TPR repeat protein
MIRFRPVLCAALLVSAVWLKAGPAAADDTVPTAAMPAVPATQVAPPTQADGPAARSGRSAPQQCEFYFDAGGGRFEAAEAAAACQRAADSGDRPAMHRLGLLSLAGIGVRRDLDAAAKLCSAAAPADAEVSASFCIAAVAAAARREGIPMPSVDRTIARPPDANAAKTIRQWRELADRGDRAATGHLCEAYFGVQLEPFDPTRAAMWCRRAAGYGDARAMLRLGLMRLWGAGVEKDAPQAEALCREAASRDPAVPAVFCIAAARQERARPAAEVSAQPEAGTAAQQNAGSGGALSRAQKILGTRHSTATGLTYRCSDFTRWSRYETADGLGVLTPDFTAFGKRIEQLGPRDYAALDAAAGACAAAVAAYDTDGGERRNLAEFQRMLPLIAARQPDFANQKRERQAEIQRCASAISNAWQMHADSPGAASSGTVFCRSGGRLMTPEKRSGAARPRPSVVGQ